MALRLHIFIITLLFMQTLAFGQETKEDIEKRANSFFNKEMYVEATPLYLHLVSLEPRNPNYNYKYGTCLLFNSEEKQQAFRYLNYAVNSGQDLELEAYYFLGKAYHLTYQFDKAIENYTLYKQKAGNRAVAKLQVDRQIEMCLNGKSLMADISETVVLKKTKIDKNSFFRIYDLKDIGGEILVTEEFQTRQDKRNNHIPIIHFPSNSNKIYYSSYGNGDNKDIYERTRLPDRTWSKAQPVFGKVNTMFNEDFPYMSPNRRYLYFCSEGHNSMGGYDIFRSIYDPETNSFGEPENLDIPISSPDNDFLYIVDSLEKYAYFSSQRTSEGDKVDVYQVRVQRIPLQFVIIKGNFNSVLNPNEKALSLTINNNSGELVGNFKTTPQGDYLINLPSGGRYEFILNVADKEQNISRFVDVPYLREFRPLKQLIIETEKDEEEIIEVHNLFNERFDNEEAIIAEAFALHAKMNVNSDNYDLDSLDRILEQRKILSEIGLSGFSNIEIHDIINSKFNDLVLRQNKTEEVIHELTQQLTQHNNDLAKALNQADSLMNIAIKNEDQSIKEKNILLAYQQIEEASKKQKNINELNQKLLYLNENYQEKESVLKKAEIVKEAISKIDASDETALLTILNEHKDFSEKLSQKTRQDALFEYQEKNDKESQKLQEVENQKKNIDQEIQRINKRLTQLQTDYENSSRRQQQSIESDIHREERALEDLKREQNYLQQKIQTIQKATANPSAFSESLKNIENESSLNVSDLHKVTQQNLALNEQRKQLENVHNELVQRYDVDLSKSPSEITTDEEVNMAQVDDKTTFSHENTETQASNDTQSELQHEIETIEKPISELEPIEEVAPEELEEYFIKKEQKEIEEQKTKQFTKEEIEELAKSFTREEIKLIDLKLQNHFSEINHEYLLTQSQHTKALDLIQAEIKYAELETLIYRLENEKNINQYEELQEEVQALQNKLVAQIDKQNIDIEINHFIEDEIVNKNYEFVDKDNLLKTEESIRDEQQEINETIRRLEKQIQENNSFLSGLSEGEREAYEKQSRQFSIIIENLTFKYEDNERKLKEIEENKTDVILADGSIDDISKRQIRKIAQSSSYKKAQNIHQVIKQKKEALETQRKLLAEKNKELQNKIERYTADRHLSAAEKEEVAHIILELDNTLREINSLNNEILQLYNEINIVIATKDESTRKNILIMLEDDIESTISEEEFIAITEKESSEMESNLSQNETKEEESNTKQPTLTQPVSEVEPTSSTQNENLKRKEEELTSLLKQEEENPQIASNKSHQNKVNAIKQDIIIQKEVILQESLDEIKENYTSKSNEDNLPSEIMVIQYSIIESERLKTLAEREKDPAQKQEILSQIEEIQTQNIQQVESFIRQQKQEEIIKEALDTYQLENLNLEDVKVSEESIRQKNDDISLHILEVDEQIISLEIERQQARKRDRAQYTQKIEQLEGIKADFLKKQENNQQLIKAIEEQRRKDNNRGITENAIETVLSYEDEVEIAQSEEYQELFNDINRLHQKQDEIKVKTELLNDTRREFQQLTSIDSDSHSTTPLSAEEIKTPLQRMDELVKDIEKLREEVSSIQNKVQQQLSTQPENKQNIENLLARDVPPIKKPITLKTMETGIFLTGEQGSYSDENPIPIEKNNIGGLVFRVQIGAFSRPVPNHTFAEFHPISGEPVRPGLIRYVAGIFNNRSTAEHARDQIRTLGYSDAFVVAYCDGERIPVYRAMELMRTGACVPEIEVENDQLFVKAEEAPSAEGVSSTQGELDLFAYNRGPNAAPAEAAEAKMGLYYTVQVGVYNKPVSAEQLFHISPLITKRLPNGQIRYSSGIFNSVEEARPKQAEVIEKGVNDAFITAYYQGNRIFLQEAEMLLNTQGESVLELHNPTVKRGNEIVNKPTSIKEEAKAPFIHGKETQRILISKTKYTEYPTQVLNRLNDKELLFYYDSISQTINTILFSSHYSIPSNLSSDFDVINVYNKIYKVKDNSATEMSTALENPGDKAVHLSIEIDYRDLNSDLLEVIYNAPFFKEVSITEQSLSADFYTSKDNEKMINTLKAHLAKLGATFHAKYD